MAAAGPIRAFLSYAHEDFSWRDRVLQHLGWLVDRGRLDIFDDRRIEAGTSWDATIRDSLAAADIIVLLLTPSFLASRYCMAQELAPALGRQGSGSAALFPIVCRPLALEGTPIAAHQCLPQGPDNDLRPLSDWDDPAAALALVAARVSRVVERLERDPTRGSTAPETASILPAAAAAGPWRTPMPPARCFGRDADVQALTDALADADGPVIVLGGAGMGKSTLARAAACASPVVARFGARRAWIALDDARTDEALVAALGAALGLPADPALRLTIEATLAAGPALVILDNLEAPWELDRVAVEGTLERLAAIPGLALLASLRGGDRPLRPAWRLTLEAGRLPFPDDRQLLLDIAAGVAPDDPALAEVLAALDGWPLAIELFAAQAAGDTSLGLSWQRWQAERTAMLDRGDLDSDRRTSLDVSLRFSLGSARLRLQPPHRPDAPALLYAMLGRLPDGLAEGAARELLGDDGPPAEAALLRARLVRREAGRLGMLAPVREHAAQRELSGAGLAALQAYGFAIARDLVRHANGDRQLDFAALARELGNVESILALPDPVATAQDLGRWSLALGDAYRALGRLGAAEAANRRGKDTLAAYAARHPDDRDAQRLLTVAWERLGDLRAAADDRRGAAAAFLEHRRLIGDLLRTDPANPAWQRDLVVSLDKLGEVLLAAGNRATALAVCSERLERCRALAAHDPDSALHQRDLAAGWDKLGNVHWAGDDFVRALDAYLAAKAIRASLHARDPADPQLCRALSVSWENIAWCHELTGDAAAALAARRTALTLSEPLALAHPDIADYRTTPAEQLEQLARSLTATGATTEPLALLDRAATLLQPLAETDRLDARGQRQLASIQSRRQALLVRDLL